MTTAELLHMGWTWEGPVLVVEDGDTHYELRVRELPDFFVAGRTREEALALSRPALKAFLDSYADVGEEPPLPADRNQTWIIPVPQPVQQAQVPVARRPGEYELVPS